MHCPCAFVLQVIQLRIWLSYRNGNYGKLVSLISKGLTSVHQEKMKSLNSGMWSVSLVEI